MLYTQIRDRVLYKGLIKIWVLVKVYRQRKENVMWTKETHWKHDVLAYHRKYEKERKKILDKKAKK